MSPAEERTLEIERVVAGGDGLARADSLVVFVPRTLAGERVRARVTVRGRLARGELVAVERTSPLRVPAACAHYEGDACGGCQLQHAAYEEQLRIKSAIVVEAMRRMAHRDVAPPMVRAAVSPWRYRRKLTLTLRRRGGSWYAGLRHRAHPDAVFALRECAITADEVLAVWRDIMAAARHLPDAPELRGSVRVTLDGNASFTLEGGIAWPESGELFAAVGGLRSLWWAPEDATRRRMHVRTDDTADASPDASFAQINEASAPAMLRYAIDRVRAYEPAHVVDGYAGTGDGASLMAAAGIRVTAIELDRDAARWAADRIPAPSRVIADRVERALAGVLPADVVLLNPPRGGLDPVVCDIIGAADPAPRAIVYVSCDPATLARDVARLPGWRIASLECFDLFPQTAHVETVCELVPSREAA